MRHRGRRQGDEPRADLRAYNMPKFWRPNTKTQPRKLKLDRSGPRVAVGRHHRLSESATKAHGMAAGKCAASGGDFDGCRNRAARENDRGACGKMPSRAFLRA